MLSNLAACLVQASKSCCIARPSAAFIFYEQLGLDCGMTFHSFQDGSQIRAEANSGTSFSVLSFVLVVKPLNAPGYLLPRFLLLPLVRM